MKSTPFRRRTLYLYNEAREHEARAFFLLVFQAKKKSSQRIGRKAPSVVSFNYSVDDQASKSTHLISICFSSRRWWAGPAYHLSTFHGPAGPPIFQMPWLCPARPTTPTARPMSNGLYMGRPVIFVGRPVDLTGRPAGRLMCCPY